MTAARRQTWSAETYGRDANFVPALGAAVLDWLSPKPGERILDLGCGDGVLTAEVAATGAAVVGTDISENLLAAARERGIDARPMDGEALAFTQEFDAVFSNAALHWMTNAGAVLQGVSRALKPQGRFVGEFGGHGNVAAIVTALRAVGQRRGGDPALAGPWFFPSAEVYRGMLEAEGFQVKRIGLFPRPTPLNTGMAAWLKVFRQPFFDQFGVDSDAVLAEVEDLLRPVLCDALGAWSADYVRLRFEATLP